MRSRLALSVATIGLASHIALVAAQQTTAPTTLTLFASVIDKSGAFVRDLSASDFTLKIDGQIRPIGSAAVDTSPVTAILLLDTSGSMTTHIARLNMWSGHLLTRMRPGDRMRIGFLDGRELQPAEFSMDRRLLAAALSAPIRPIAATLLWTSLEKALNALNDQPGYRAVVVLSDGEDTASITDSKDVFNQALAARVAVHSIEPPPIRLPAGPGGSPINVMARSNAFRNLVRDTGGTLRRVPSVDDQTAIRDIDGALHERYAITFVPRSFDRKLHSIELRTSRRNLTVVVSKRY